MDNSELIQLENSLRQKPTEELISIWTENKKDKWPEEAFKIIKRILTEQGIKIPKQKSLEDSMVSAKFCKDVGAPFFSVSTKKLVIMSLCTFGIYEIFWFYKNWKFLKEKHNFKIKPFWRALFSILFCHSFFKIVKEYSMQHQVETDYKPVQLAVAYIVLSMLYKAPDPIWPLANLTFIPLIYVQKVINNLRKQLSPTSDINSKFSGWNIVGIILGLILWAVVILGMIFPE